jgi:hypothetical protein
MAKMPNHELKATRQTARPSSSVRQISNDLTL